MTDPAIAVRDDTPTHIINPLPEVLTFEKFDEENRKVTYIIPSLEVVTYPKWLAEVLRKHIVTAMINARKAGIISPELREKYMKETEVETL